METKVSVIIPAYNKANLTVKTVESVLNQTYRNIEVIVVDDGSTDNTKQCLIPYADKIRYVYKKNGGACSARNLGIRLATGDYIGLLDCDDLYLPKKIELCINFLEKHPDVVFVHTPAYFINEKGNVLRTYSPYKGYQDNQIAKRLLLRNFICNSTVVVRKSCFEKVGLFDESIFTPADWDMWLRIAEQYKLGYVNIPLTLYRASESYILNHIEQSKKEGLIVLQKAFRRNLGIKINFRNKAVANFYRDCAISYLLTGDFDKAKNELISSIRKNKLNVIAILLLIYFIVARKNLQFIIRKKVFYNFGL